MSDCKKELYNYLNEQIESMAEEWLKTLSTNKSAFYRIEEGQPIKEELVNSYHTLVKNVLHVFHSEETVYKASISEWAVKVAKQRSQDAVPILESIEQLTCVKSILIKYIQKFAEESQENFSISNMFNWLRLTNYAFDIFTNIFIEYYDKFKHQQLSAQQETIYELSSPVIPITKGIGVLPLLGDIDTQRANIIMETTLKQCNNNNMEKLFIDLSGVPIIDTMVAQQIFHVIHALNLIGVTAYLSGLRPEVAQTAIQLGVDFSRIPIFNNLASALSRLGITVIEG
ncbi:MULTISPECIES: STAS domain-containing protein [Bacillaceae]|uniref:STAS domain-containing protein n=1 Tax=Bacillaceae TaxID=186817 RepID=UPI001E49E2CF|nr:MULTISPECIES: STAS domain-containing protein [Bacillaceae]MCE4052177.1 STAS domain-containing protein [Bacillus sp. Au-Bac7]MCM3029621.1 STAS domain-containing protein [Niallia sp. MER 6]MDL0437051.1 STAS domain-containing protein [Niallia sp. SS-2023]UPO87154.1 STAS domain-containing protein [Niallia sp. Man26]